MDDDPGRAASRPATQEDKTRAAPRRYAAFISYSHSAGREVARGLQKWLQTFAKPWWRWRAVNVFRDETDLAAAPALWSKITSALDDSSHFIFLASPEAARSKWCKREVRHWLGEVAAGEVEGAALDAPLPVFRRDRADTLLVALIGGDIAWNEDAGPDGKGDFDREKTTALPPVLFGVFAEEPQWVDLRAIADTQDLRRSLSRSNAAFMQAVAQLSAPIRGISDFSRLVSEDYRQHKRTLRTAWAGVAALAMIAGLAVWQWREAEFQRAQAETELAGKQISQSRFLLDQSARALAENDATTAILLALEALPAKVDAPGARPYVAAAEAALHAAVAANRELRDFAGHTDDVRAVGVSPDGTRIATASEDGSARIWDAETGAAGPVFVAGERKGGAVGNGGDPAETIPLGDIAFSPDGSRILATGSFEAYMLDARDMTLLSTLAGHTAEITSGSFSPDGTRVLTASIDDTARIFDPANGRPLLVLVGGKDEEGTRIRVDRVRQAVFSPDGRLVATASEGKPGSATLWDAETGDRIRTVTHENGIVTDAAFSPDGAMLVTSSNDGTARLWDVATGAMLRTFVGHGHTVISARFNPKGTEVVTASYDRVARVYDAVETGGGESRPLYEMPGHRDYVLSAEFSADGTRILTASADGTARLWDAENDGAALAVLAGHTGWIYDAVFSPDGSRIVTCGPDGTARLWHALGPGALEELRLPGAQITSAAFSPDETRLVTGDGNGHPRLWDAATGKMVLDLNPRGGRPVSAVAFTPDGTRVLVATFDGEASLVDLASGARTPPVEHHSRIAAAALSPDGTRVATVDSNGEGLVWNSGDGSNRVAFAVAGGDATSLSFAPDGRAVAVGSFDNTARLYDAVTGKETKVFETPDGVVAALAFSPDGKWLATGADEGVVRIRDVSTGETHALLLSPGGQPRGVGFSADGRRVASAATDGKVRVWSVDGGAPLVVLDAGPRPVVVAFSRDGRRLITGSATGARLWQGFPTTQALIDHAQSLVPRTLTAEQRRAYYLDEVKADGVTEPANREGAWPWVW